MADHMSMRNFSISIEQTLDARTLKAHKPDKDGVYCGIPVMVLGKASRNHKVYDIPSVINGITNPNSNFNVALRTGTLEGEWRHPSIPTNISKQELIRMTMEIRREVVSHYFVRIQAKPTSDGKYTIIYADLVPFGPMGQYLKDSLEDPRRNTNFSLRAVVDERGEDASGNDLRYVLAMVTFDAVSTSGYDEASKRYALENLGAANEHLLLPDTEINDYRIDLREAAIMKRTAQLCGCEAFNSQELLDILQADSVRTITNVKCMVDIGCRQLRTSKGVEDIFKVMHRGGMR